MKWSFLEQSFVDWLDGKFDDEEWLDLLEAATPRQLRRLIALISGVARQSHECLQNFRKVVLRPVGAGACTHPPDLIQARPR